jgi:hypothetical protein
VVTVINVGGETAANVLITARLPEQVTKSPAKPELSAGETFTRRLPLDAGLKLPGTYAVEILVDFTDQSGRPFSAAAYALLTYKEAAGTMVFPQPGRAVIEDTGQLSFEVINVDPASHHAFVRLILPRELGVREPRQILDLSGREKKTVVFNIKNFSAREGAVYPVLTFVEYEADGRHYASVGEHQIRVQGEDNFFKKHQVVLIAFAVFLMLIVIVIQIRRPPKDA